LPPHWPRALSAAHPLLEKAQRVVLLHIADEAPTPPQWLEHLAEQLKWHGITVEVRIVAHGAEHLAARLEKTTAELHADLLVAGGFGHSRLRELIFGGVTQSLLEHADCPVFMMY
jgi:nucleotide-binding universal stress UspA family protein